MRLLFVFLPLAFAVLMAEDPRPAEARPPFARREGRGCGYCHINPRGGGARNARGLEYARNEFKFPPRKADLNAFIRERDKKAMIHVRKMIDIDHVKVAVSELRRLSKSAKGEAGKQAARTELHSLDVRGAEVLGASRRLIRKSDGAEQAIELLLILVTEYKGLDVHAQAKVDLRELNKEPEYKPIIVKEQREAKARLMFLDAMKYRTDGRLAQAESKMQKIVDAYPDTRAAKSAGKYLPKPGEGAKKG